MRLWHIYTLDSLPGKLLATLHRDMCKWRTKPFRTNRQRDWWLYGPEAAHWYHSQVLAEMASRGWCFDAKWHNPRQFGKHGISEWACKKNPYPIELRYRQLNGLAEIMEDIAEINRWKVEHGTICTANASATA